MRCFFVLLLGKRLTNRTRCMNSWWPRLKGLRKCWEVPMTWWLVSRLNCTAFARLLPPLWRSPKFLLWHFETKPADHCVNIDLNVRMFFLYIVCGGKCLQFYPILLFKIMILWSSIWTAVTNSNWIPLIRTEQSIIPLELGTTPLRRIAGRKIKNPHCHKIG